MPKGPRGEKRPGDVVGDLAERIEALTARPMKARALQEADGRLGANFFIWIAIVVVVISAIPGWYGHYWIAGAGYAVGIVLVVANKVLAIRRRRSDKLHTFD